MENVQKERPPKGFYATTLVLGLGFFTMGLMDPLYDSYVPLFLGDFLDSKFLIGLVMTLDNMFAILLIPLVSAWSDRVRTPLGRRMPFVVVTLPLSALAFALLPMGAQPRGTLMALIALIFILNLFKQAARGPVVALMPDVTPAAWRSEANGAINVMGGLAAILGTLVLAPLMDVNIELPLLGSSIRLLPFLIAGALVTLATVILVVRIRENAMVARLAGGGEAQADGEQKSKLFAGIARVFGKGTDPDARNILLALFLWFLGYQGMLPFVTMYSRDLLGTSEGLAAFSPGAVAVAYALFAIPSGMLAHRFGRRTTIRQSLLGLIVVLALIFAHHSFVGALGMGTTAAWISFLVLLFLFGMCWGSVVTNSFPMLWQAADRNTMGMYTGLYYFFSQAAAISAPLVSGAIIDIVTQLAGPAWGLRSIFAWALVTMTGAWLVMARVRREQ